MPTQKKSAAKKAKAPTKKVEGKGKKPVKAKKAKEPATTATASLKGLF